MGPADYDWNDLRYLLACWRAGSLSGAARLLKVDQTTVGRRLSALESALDTRLFDRLPTGFVLTAAGSRVIEHAEQIEQGAIDLGRRAGGEDPRLEGTVRLATSETLANTFLLRDLISLHRAHPRITLEVVVSMTHMNLVRREADLALRAGSPPAQQSVIIRRLGELRPGLYASPAYLAEHPAGDPARPLDGHEVIAYGDDLSASVPARWIDDNLAGARVVLRTNGFFSAAAAARGGWGLAVLPSIVGERDPELVRLEAPTLEPVDLWLLVHADLVHTPRVRVVIDHLVAVIDRAGGLE